MAINFPINPQDGDYYTTPNGSKYEYVAANNAWVKVGLQDVGNPGPTGVAGATGSQGVDGSTGIQGTTGTKGVDGSTGTQGTTGYKGVDGSTGLQGSTGIIGETGSQGHTGTQGRTGMQGITGVANFTRGSSFPTSPSDRQLYWDIEDEIIYFYDAFAGSWIDISSGAFPGKTGMQGLQGSTGIRGSTGVGSQGATGVRGETGRQGATGVQGHTGGQGIDGSTGLQGATGLQSATGIQGTTGSQGSTGVQGSTGLPGVTGIQGNDGADRLLFYAYDAGGGIDISAGFTGIDLDTNARVDSEAYSHTADTSEITFNKSSLYEITYYITTDATSGTSRSESEAKLQEDVGSGFVDVPGTRALLYNRQSSQGGTAASATILRSYDQGDKIRLVAGRNSGSNTIKTLENSVGIVIRTAESSGAQGSTGMWGVTGSQGATGIQGSTGVQGETGSQGETGVQGYTGIQGSTGVQGETGSQGETGTQGHTGSEGKTLLYHHAADFDNPGTQDWGVTGLAPALQDGTNVALTVRAFDDTTEEGVGFIRTVPAGTASLRFFFKHRAASAPGGASAVVPKLYYRTVSDNSSISSWSSSAFSALSIPTNTNYQYDDETKTLSSLSLTAGDLVQFELTRDSGNGSDTLTGDWYLVELLVEAL